MPNQTIGDEIADRRETEVRQEVRLPETVERLRRHAIEDADRQNRDQDRASPNTDNPCWKVRFISAKGRRSGCGVGWKLCSCMTSSISTPSRPTPIPDDDDRYVDPDAGQTDGDQHPSDRGGLAQLGARR